MYSLILWLIIALSQGQFIYSLITHRFTIGAVLSSKQSREFFLQEIDSIKSELPPNLNIRAKTVPMHANPILTANEVCTKLIPHQIHTVVVSHLPDQSSNQTVILTDHNSASSVSFTCGFLGIPVISISNRNSALSDKQLHRTFLRTVPAYTNQAKIWLLLLRRLRYNNFILIHRADQEGLSALSKVNEWAHKLKMQMERAIAFESIFSGVRTTSRSHAEDDAMFEQIYRNTDSNQGQTADDIISIPSIANQDNHFSYNGSQLRNKFENVLRNTNCRVFLLYANTAEEAMYVIRVAKGLNMFGPGFVWILSEQSLLAPSLAGAQLSDLPEGALAVRLAKKASDEHRHIKDAVTLITKSLKTLIKDMNTIPTNSPPSDCNTTQYQNWVLGVRMLQLLRNEKLDNGTTGRLAFDYKGDRLETDYEIVNIQHEVINNTIQRVKKVVGSHFYNQLANSTTLQVNISDIIWPSGIKDQPLGYFVPTHLNIVTLPEQPFVETRRVYPKPDAEIQEKNQNKGLDFLNISPGVDQVKMSNILNESFHFSQSPEFSADTYSNYSQHPNWTPDNLLYKRSTSMHQYLCKVNEVHCPHINGTNGVTTHYCCSGYCIDLLLRLADALNFTFNLYQVPDLSYGVKKYYEDRVEWNGLIGELLSKRADMSIGTLTINPERAKVIDFSKPFKYQGIGMLQLRISKGARLASFLQPFHGTLWILVLFSVHVVALVLYLLDRFSPFGKFRIKEDDTCNADNQTRGIVTSSSNTNQQTGQNELNRKASALSSVHDTVNLTENNNFNSGEKALTFSGAIWFSWGVLLNSGVGEKTPRSFSARVLGMVWAGFAMIVVASYTANLAAFLVLDSTETQIQGLDDPRLRNPVEGGFTYGTVKDSSVDVYFRGQVVLSNMYRLMEENNRATAQEAIDAVKNGDMDVFFFDSPRIEYEASRDCDLVISGETFGRSGYGIALQKNSFWTERVTLQLLRLLESGFMETLDNKWILRTEKQCDKHIESFPTTLGLENMAGVFMLVGAGIVASIGLIFIEIAYKRRRLNRIRALTSAKRCAYKWRLKVKQRRLANGLEEIGEKPINKIDFKSTETSPRPFIESRATTVTPTSLSKHRPPSRPTGFSNQIYPVNQYPTNYLSSPSPVCPVKEINCPYNIEHSIQEMRVIPSGSAIKNQMQAHPIDSTLTSPNLNSRILANQLAASTITRPKSGFGINQPPVAASYMRSTPTVQQIKRTTPGPPLKLKRADMYIATRQNKDDFQFDLPPPPPPPTQILGKRAGYRR